MVELSEPDIMLLNDIGRRLTPEVKKAIRDAVSESLKSSSFHRRDSICLNSIEVISGKRRHISDISSTSSSCTSKKFKKTLKYSSPTKTK